MDSPGLPERLRQYEISERLSREGKLRTYLAIDTNSQRSVALKTIRMSAGDQEGAGIVAQLKNQALVSSHLKHPGILEVYEYGEDAGVAFLAMEYVQGCVLKPGLRIPIADVGSAITQLLEALDYAHRRGVVHLEIQPACLLLTSKGHLRVMDFGTADVKPRAPAYAAPERIRGQATDSRSDVFSAGAWFYELLSGAPPFGNSAEGLAERICQQKEQPPSQADAKIPATFDAVCAKALAKNPGERYATAREFADEIRRAYATAFGASPREALSNETVVSAFVSTLRGESRKGASSPPSGKSELGVPSAEERPRASWPEDTLKTVERQLAHYLGPVAGVVVRNAAQHASSLEDLYRRAADSLGSDQDQQAFLTAHMPTAAESSGSKAAPASAVRSDPPMVSRNEGLLPSSRGDEVRIMQRVVPLSSPSARERPVAPQAKAPAPAPKATPGMSSRPERAAAEQPDTLARYLGDQPAEVDAVVPRFIAATEALAALYAANGKSGGLAPENVRFDKTGKAFIRVAAAPAQQGATCYGSIGSPQYAPPEIFKETDTGASTSPALSDVYTLGFMFYEILLGRTLFRQTFAAQHTDLDWLRWHTDAKAKAPALKSLLANRSVALSELLQSMMEKDVAQRTSDFNQILLRLRSVEQHSNRTMIGPSPVVHMPKASTPSKSHKSSARVLIILVALLLAGVLIWQGPTLYQWIVSMVSRYVELIKRP